MVRPEQWEQQGRGEINLPAMPCHAHLDTSFASNFKTYILQVCGVWETLAYFDNKYFILKSSLLLVEESSYSFKKIRIACL